MSDTGNDIRFKSIEDKVDYVIHLLELQNGRVRKLEVWRGWMTGGLAVLSVVIGIMLKVVF